MQTPSSEVEVPAAPASSDAEVAPVVVPDPDEPLPTIDARGASIMTLAILATLFALQAASKFVIPIVVSILLTYALDPVVSWLERRHVPRVIGALLTLLVLVCGSAYGVYALRFQAQAIVDGVPDAVNKISRALDVFDTGKGAGFDNVKKAADALQKATDQATGTTATKNTTVVVMEKPGGKIKDILLAGGQTALEMFGQAVMVIFLVFFLLIAGDQFKRKFVRVAGRTLSEKKISVQMFDEINRSIQRYMAVLLLTNLILAIVSWGAFTAIGLANAGTWGVVAGVLHLVPYFGPIMVALATGVAALMQFGSFGMAAATAGMSLVIATLIGVVLMTWLTGRIARMNTVAVFIALLLFGWMWGFWGVLLSIPLTVIIKVVSDHVEELKGFSEFLGD